MRLSTWLLAGSLGLGTCLASVSAAADEQQANAEEARRLYSQARKDFEAESFREAAEGFEAAAKLVQHAVALYTAAQAWERAGDPARAADAYTRALSTPKLEEKQAERVRQRVAELEAELGTLIITGDEATRVQLDDHTEVNLPATLHAAPGDHTLLITSSDGNVERRAIKAKKGDRVEVELGQAPEKPVEAQPKPVPQAEPKQQPVIVEAPAVQPTPVLRTVGFVAAGVGAGVLVGGVFLGLAAKDAESTYKASPTRETFDHAESLQGSTNLALILGGVLTVGGVGLVLWQSAKQSAPAAESDQVSLHVGPSGGFVKGSF